MPARIERLFGLENGELAGLAEAFDLALVAALFGDAVQLGLGLLDLGERRDVLGGVECILDHVAADADQRAE